MDFELTEDQRAFADTARQFALAELAPHAAHWDAEGIFPKEAIAKAGELGFCGLKILHRAGIDLGHSATRAARGTRLCPGTTHLQSKQGGDDDRLTAPHHFSYR